MTDRLSDDARDFITQALGSERAPSSDELARIRRGVIAATAGAGTVLAGGSAAALAGKTLGATLFASAVKGVVFGVVVTVGASSVSSYLDSGSSARQSENGASQPAPTNAGESHGKLPEPAVEVTSSLTKPDPAIALPAEPPKASRMGANEVSLPERDAVTTRDEAAPAPLGRESTAEFAPTSGALAFELDVLRRAQAELRANHGVEALRILDENAGRLAGGRLGQERLAVEVLAACQAGEAERARRAVRRLHRENVATPAAERIRASCVGGELP